MEFVTFFSIVAIMAAIGIISFLFTFIPIVSIGAIVATLIGVVWFEYPLFAILSANWLSILGIIVGYIVVGCIWAFVSWYLELRKAARNYEEKRRRMLPVFLRDNNLTELTSETREDFKHYMLNNFYLPPMRPPLPFVLGQISYWPISVMKFLFGDLLVVLARSLTRVFGGAFLRIHRSVFKRFDELN